MNTFHMGNRVIGAGYPSYIIAELSANHRGSLEEARELIRLAHEAGADAVKLQTYTADTMTIDSDAECFRIRGGPWDGYRLYDLYRDAHTPWEWHAQLFEDAAALGLGCFSTPFDATAVDFLERFAPVAYKVASFELTDEPLLAKIASCGRPVIISSGMASVAEIGKAVTLLRNGGCPNIAILKCTSAYPAPPSSFNLATIPSLAATFNVVAGLSDHSLGSSVATAAVALGARIIEKHICKSRALGGPDSGFSMEPAEFALMVQSIRQAEAAVGTIQYGPGSDEQANLCFRRSLFAVRDISVGERFTNENVRVIRPGHGLPSSFLGLVMGRRASRALLRGTPLTWDVVGEQ